MELFDLEPKFITVLADDDGYCRWKVTLRNFDTADKPIDLLIMMDADGGIALASRPPHNPACTWSPPVFPART
jgi:hypothetical protein